MAKTKTARNENKRFLSVVPVTSREETGTTARQPNLRAMLMQRMTREKLQAERHSAFAKRIEQAIKALGKRK